MKQKPSNDVCYQDVGLFAPILFLYKLHTKNTRKTCWKLQGFIISRYAVKSRVLSVMTPAKTVNND